MTAVTVNFLPSWASAPQDAPTLRTLSEDGTLHFSELKALALSPRQYLARVNLGLVPTAPMRLGTLVHWRVLGAQRAGAKPIVIYDGRRSGKAWEDFEARHAHAEIFTAAEDARAQEIAAAVLADPIARARLEGARVEVPLTWEEGGLKCSTSGIDVLTASAALGDLKATSTVHPDTWTRHAFRMLYPQQLAWYRRGARACGLDVRGGLFLLGVETKAPFEVVDLELTEAMLDFADRTLTLWLERLEVLLASCPSPRSFLDWPGYAQAPIPWDVPPWHARDEEADDEDEDAGGPEVTS
jgi:hypothetical protein